MKRSRARWVGLACVLGAASASAHDFDPGVLAIVELPPGGAATHRYKLTQPNDTRAPDAAVRVRFPAACSVDERVQTLACPPGALGQPLAFVGLDRGTARARMIVSAQRQGGGLTQRVVEGDAPFTLDPPLSGAAAWAGLGVRHLFAGPDHLAFLLALSCLVARGRALALAITAFSVGHAFSLGLAVSGLVSVPVAPTEALIALSVVLVAREALGRHDTLQPPPTLLARAPFVASLGFGLIHGLGFASALGDAGFPREGLLTALLAFHIGIEAAQLSFVAMVVVAWLGIERIHRQLAHRSRTAALYVVGAGGAFWTLARAAQVLTSP